MLKYIYNCLKELYIDLVGSKVRFLVYDVSKITLLLKPDF
jgi:hypothetical protein